MIEEHLYDKCKAILDGPELDETKVELIEEVLSPIVSPDELETSVLEVLWRSKEHSSPAAVALGSPLPDHKSTKPAPKGQANQYAVGQRVYNAVEAQSEYVLTADIEKRMAPFDMIRSVIGYGRTDSAIKKALADCGFDIPEALTLLTKMDNSDAESEKEKEGRNRTVCRHFMAGSCRRSDCWFSHDLNRTVCKYWLNGNCLAGSNCVFSHDPSTIVSELDLKTRKPKEQTAALSDEKSFPSLGSAQQKSRGGPSSNTATGLTMAQIAKTAKKAPKVPMLTPKKTATKTRVAIAPPSSLPYVSVGSTNNASYLKHRADAISQGALRNKFLSLAAEAWRRGDPAGAKKLSVRANDCEVIMRGEHQKAAEAIFGERNEGQSHGDNNFVDLHALHPTEGIAFLESRLLDLKSSSKPLYAIVGSGHHSSQGIDRLAKAVKLWLDDWGYTWREFSMDEESHGGVIGIDPSSCSE